MVIINLSYKNTELHTPPLPLPLPLSPIMDIKAVLEWLEKQQHTLNLPPLALILISLFSLLILLKLIKGFWSKKTNMYLLPSPPALPFIGNIHQMGNLPHRSLCDLANKYGPLMLLHLWRQPAIVVSSADLAKEVKKTHDVAFANRPQSVASEILFYGSINMAFSPYGEYWRQLRKICNLEFLCMNRVQNFKFVREEEVAKLVETVSDSAVCRVPVNLTQVLLDLSNVVLSRCALGQVSEEKGGNLRMGDLSRQFIRLLIRFSFQDSFPVVGWMDHVTGLVRKLKNVTAELDTFLDQIIHEHDVRKTQEGREDFVDFLLHAQKNNTEYIDFNRNHIKALVLDMFLGGTDTSSITIVWTLSELMRHPSAMKKVQEEVRRVVGNKPLVEEEDIPHMDYMKAVFKEMLRLHPPIPVIDYISSMNIDLKGYKIPAKTTLLLNAWAIQRDPTLWKNPNEFIPERFVDSKYDYKGLDYEYIPFGSGRRGCPGITFGLTLVEYILANLLYLFDWELPQGMSIDMDELAGSIVSKKNPLLLVPKLHHPQI